MSNVLKLIKLDYYTSKVNYKTFLIVYVLAIFLAVLKQPALTIMIVMLFSGILCGMVFSIYEKNNLSKLYGSLPLAKFEVVIGRYLYALFFGIINLIASGIIANIISLFANKGKMDYLTFITFLSGFFLYFCLAIGISFPIYFKYGFSKAYLLTMLPLYIIAMGGILISRKTGAKNNLKEIIQYFTNNPAMILVAGIGLGLILLIISFLFSCAFFKRKEL